MTPGWQTCIGEYEPPSGVIGIVCAKSFPDHEIIRAKITEGVEHRPDDVWVIREKPQANHAVTVVWQTLDELGVEAFHSDLVPGWKGEGYDLRRPWVDLELRSTCERLIVFHDLSSGVTAKWGKIEHSVARVFVIEREG